MTIVQPLTEEAAMVSFSKIISVVACSVVLGVGVFGATQAIGSTGHNPCADRKGGLPNLVMCDTAKSGMHSSPMQATANMRHDPCADRKGGQPNLVACSEELRQGIETIKGEVLRVEGVNYVVERFDGKELELHIDKATKMGGTISQGDRIEAKVGEVNNQIHVLSLRRLE
jgi:hypothetical protein